jgi:hypothetical protein
MPRTRVSVALAVVCLLALVSQPLADNTTQSLPFSQDWSDTSLIAVSDDWSGVPGIVGYRGDGLTSSTGVNPQAVVADGSAVIDVNANQTAPNTFTAGGLSEFHIADPVIALQGSGTARAPHIVISASTLGLSNVNVAYNLRDIDGSADNALQPVALQYRVGTTGDFTNVPAGFVADATTGPSLATQVTPVSVILPAEASNQPLVQIRILTADAVGSDEWVGIDDISISTSAQPTPPTGLGAASPSAVTVPGSSLLTVDVTPGVNPTSTGIAVTADLSSIDGSSAQPFFDDGTNGDVTAGDLLFSYEAALTTTAPGVRSLPVTIADAQARSSVTSIALTINAPAADVVISQIYGGGGNSGAIFKNDFLVLYNREAVDVSLSGWSVQYASATGTSWQVAALTGTIRAGGYHLVQLAAGTGGGALLPTPDSTGGFNMSGSTGKVALVAATSPLAGTCPKDAAVDFVGFGSSASCFEGSGPTATLSNSTAAIRQGDGTIDTDDNASDFATGTPVPLNSSGLAPAGTGSATPALVVPGDHTLLAVTVTPGRAPASTGITVVGDLTPIGGAASQPFFDDGSNGDAAAGDNVFSYAALVGTTTTQGTKSITTTIADAQARTSTASIALAVSPTPTPIHAIQGAGTASPLAGQTVTTAGVVTGVKSNGFFLQSPDHEADADPQTSQGVFVFTGGAPTTTLGDRVVVTGTATEFFDLTEISSSNAFVVTLASGWPLPTAVALTPAILDPAGSHAALEGYEAMRVQAGTLISVAPTNQFGEIETVLPGVARPMREPGIGISLPVPPDPVTGTIDCCIPRWDENPERIMIDTDGLLGMSVVSATSNVAFSNVAGPLDYAFSRFKIVPEAPLVQTTPNMTAVAVPAPAANEFTVAGYNIEFFANAPTQRRKAALAIREVMRSPDVIGVVEIADLASLQALADEVNTLATGAGESNPAYDARLVPASPTATQNVGFLVKTSRVRIDGVTQERADETFTTPSGEVDLLHDRPPLVLRATVDPLAATAAGIIAVVNHPRSFIDVELEGGEGPRVRAKRTKQAESIAGLLQELQAANPGTPIVAVGDYNAFQFNDGYTDPISIVKGMPTSGDQVVVAGSPDLVDPDFANLTDGLPADQQYSFVFDGTPQAIDHVLVNNVAKLLVQRYAVARSNADFPDTAAYANDPSRPERNSDHDMPVAYFAIPGTPVVTLIGGATMTVEAFTSFTDPGATASDANGPLPVTVTGSVNVNVPGEYTLSYSATNGYRTTTVTRTVRVVDTTQPAITVFSVSPSMLMVPDHTMQEVGASYSVADASGVVQCTLSVSSNESPNGRGDGGTEVDWVVLDPTRALVRAERSGNGTGRVYTLLVSCSDPSGNTATGTVTVPHNR